MLKPRDDGILMSVPHLARFVQRNVMDGLNRINRAGRAWRAKHLFSTLPEFFS
jgi:hypothetical protein